jgi:proline iminopeptidase
MSRNTTEHLLADMEQLRHHLGVDRWLLFGGSWGSTLILAYAERHPDRVSEIVIPAVTTTRRSEIDWLYQGVARFFPEEWHRFRAASRRRIAMATSSQPTHASWRTPIRRCARMPRSLGAPGKTP